MKFSAKISVILLPAVFTAGCGDFLERSAQDLYIPATTEDYANILRGESYFNEILAKYDHVAMMTDDVQWFDINYHAGFDVSQYGTDTRFMKFRDSYTWQKETENVYFEDGAYQFLYKQAQVANICLENVEESRGTRQEKETLRGQASFIRAFAYLMLANIYAPPYNRSQPGDPCVPVKLSSTPSTGKYARENMETVYGLILSDIQTALEDLKDKEIGSIYEVGYPAALILAMRTALYMEDWDAAIRYGEDFLASGEYPLLDITAETKATNSSTQSADTEVKNFVSARNSEIAWAFGGWMGYPSSNYVTLFNFLNNSCGGYRVDGPLPVITSGTSVKYAEGDAAGTFIGIFDYDFATKQGDRRLPYWFMRPLWRYNSMVSKISNYVSLKFDYNDGEINSAFTFRTGEVYITLAEAYARKPSPDAAAALRYLNALREKRIAPYTALQTWDFADTGELVEFVWEERRRELCMEELHRWWDLRRTTQPRIVHRIDGLTWTLEEGDPAYTLNFPAAEREYNGATLGGNHRNERPHD